MKKFLITALILMTISSFSYSQNYFAISQINIEPEYPTTDDSIRIHLIGYLTETGVIIDNVEVLVQDNEVFLTINVHSSGGFQMLIDHTETINLGLLSSGDYHINISGDYISDNVSDPSQYHFTVEEATGILSQTSNAKFSVYPNPASVYVSVDFTLPISVEQAELQLINAEGKVLQAEKVSGPLGQITFDIRSFKPGPYIFRLLSDKFIISEPVIIE